MIGNQYWRGSCHITFPEKAAETSFGAGVVPLDQIAVVAVHDAHESGKVRCRARVQRLAKLRRCRRQFGYNIRYSLWYFLQACGLNALDALDLG
jgi:hypothetical protein